MRALILNPVSGISGDMFCAALFDTLVSTGEVSKEELRREWNSILVAANAGLTNPVQDLSLSVQETTRRGMRACKIDFPYKIPLQTEGGLLRKAEELRHRHRSYTELKEALDRAGLEDAVKTLAQKILRTLAEAEAEIHGKPVEDIHLHEAGSEDSFFDMVSAAWLFHKTQAGKVYSSAVHLASAGTIEFSHGVLPLPAPATLKILGDFPLHFTKETNELTTPTGAAILVSLETREISKLQEKTRVFASGYGAGSRELKSRPNILRAMLCQINSNSNARHSSSLLERARALADS